VEGQVGTGYLFLSFRFVIFNYKPVVSSLFSLTRHRGI
jgi:hypothetical protein